MHGWASARRLELLRRGARVFGLGSLAERRTRPPEVVGARRSRQQARAERDFGDRRPAARRAGRRRMGDARRAAAVSRSCAVVTRRSRLRPAVGPGGAPRPPRGARGLGDGTRVGAEPWLVEAGAKLKLDRELTERAGTRDHQGVLALVEPYRYADGYELAGPSGRCSPSSTGSPTRGNSARSAGAPRRRRHRRRRAPPTGRPSSRRRSRAPRPARSSTCRSRSSEPRSLPRGGQGPRPLGLRRGRRGGRAVDVGDRPLGGPRPRVRCGGQRAAPARPAHLRRTGRSPLAGAVASLNVSVAAALLLYEAKRQRG